MNNIQEIFIEYKRMRENNLDSKEALRALSHYITPLNKGEREELAKHLRAYESRDPQPSANVTGSHPTIKPLAPQAPETSEITWVICPNCNKANQRHDVFCYSCGQLLETIKGQFDTHTFTDSLAAREDYFGAESILVLQVRNSAQSYEVRPQTIDHDIVLGRSTASAMVPDIDLSGDEAAELGVSRLHMALRYDAKHQTVSVLDLGSSNGTYINGHKLHPQEVRVLRHGDALRLGKLVMKVYFRHPGDTGLLR